MNLKTEKIKRRFYYHLDSSIDKSHLTEEEKRQLLELK